MNARARFNSPTSIIFLTLCLIFLTWIQFFPSLENPDILRSTLSGASFATIKVFIFLLIMPLCIVRFVFGRQWNEFGWQLPENKLFAVRGTVLVILALMPAIFLFSKDAAFQAYYGASQLPFFEFLLGSVVLSAFYYVAEEFLFRGFLLFGLVGKIGYHGVWVSNVLFALAHFSKPLPEIAFSFSAGILFSYLALKTKSFVPAAIAHFAVALVANTLITFAWSV